ncbi:MAG TPA: tetratricopeptide repeat protein [Puia sp.]|nr:tetratricopeptide repeat protein [Puia sp.]
MRSSMGLLNKMVAAALVVLIALVAGCRQPGGGVVGGGSVGGGVGGPREAGAFRRQMATGRQLQIGGQNEEALRLFTAAHQMALQHAMYPQLCEAKIDIGEIVYDRGNYDSALTWFQQAEKIAETHGLVAAECRAQYYIGKYNETKGNFKQASYYYDKVLAMARSQDDTSLLVPALISRGKNYINEGKLNLALQNYLEAFQLSEQLHDSLLYAQTSSHLGSLYSLLNEYDKALQYDLKAFSSRDNLNNPEGIAKSYNNIGILFHKLGRTDSAFDYFFRALDLCKSTHYKKGLVKALNNIGNLYSEQGDDEKAFRYIDTAFQISQKSGFGFGIASSALNLANLHRKKGQLSRALSYYRLSLARLSGTDYDEMLQNIYQGLYECYATRGEYRTALGYHVLLLETQRRLLNVEKARQLSVLNISFDLERKEKDNQVLRADNELKESLIKRKTTFIWLVVIALSFTLVLCLYIYHRLYANKKANRQLEKLNHTVTEQNGALARLNEQLELANREKDKLFSIISHELRNPLYWFQNLSEVLSKKFREMPPEKVQKSLSALDESAKNAFHLMDNLLQWSRSKLKRVHPRKAEHELRPLVADTVEMYLTILRYKEVEFCNDIPDGVRIYADADLFGCVIRNLVSNAIKYTPAAGTIRVGCSITEDIVTVVVRDSGMGIRHTDIGSIFSEKIVSAAGLMQEKGSGIGLKLCKEFVELNGGIIRAESMPGGGTSFYFTVIAAVAVDEVRAAMDGAAASGAEQSKHVVDTADGLVLSE